MEPTWIDIWVTQIKYGNMYNGPVCNPVPKPIELQTPNPIHQIKYDINGKMKRLT